MDGTNFTQAASFSYSLVVNQIGPYAGNCCGTTSPAFTAYVDYFFNSASPISPADRRYVEWHNGSGDQFD